MNIRYYHILFHIDPSKNDNRVCYIAIYNFVSIYYRRTYFHNQMLY